MKLSVLSLILTATFTFGTLPSSASSLEKLTARSNEAAKVLHEVNMADDSAIPTSLLERATCVATIPNVVRAGFVFGGKRGKGLASCRVGSTWSQPIFLTLTGGSWGFQIGVDSTDLVLVFVSENGIDRLAKSSFRLGADITVSAGPVGRNAAAGIDYQLTAETLAYSRSKGVFAGISIDGSILAVDGDSNHLVYGDSATATRILSTRGDVGNNVGTNYVRTLDKYAR